MSTVIKCDRCDKVITDDADKKAAASGFIGADEGFMAATVYDLCKHCFRQFGKFINDYCADQAVSA